MPTTIEVRDDTKRLLNRLKHEMGVSSYDEVIQRLAKKMTRVPSSLFGSCKGSMPFVREKEYDVS